MTALSEQLRTDLTASMKARDELRTTTIRSLLAALKNASVATTPAHELDDAETDQVLMREARKRQEAADGFTSGGRAERAERELAEKAIIEAYLPKQLTDEELADLVREAIAESGASGKSAMGPVMKLVSPKVAGRATGARVSSEVRAQLGL